jgi:hypothetical protein
MPAIHALSSPKAPVRFTAGTPASSSTDTNIYTFNSVSFSTAADDRIVGCIAGSRANASRSLTSITIDGTAADWFASSNDAGGGADMISMAIRRVPAGTSGTIVVTYSNTMLRCGMIPFVIYGAMGGSLASPFDTKTDIDIGTLSASAVARVGAIIVAGSWVGGVDHTLTWGGVSHDATVDAETTGGETSLAHLICNTVSNVGVTAQITGGSAAEAALITLTIPAG